MTSKLTVDEIDVGTEGVDSEGNIALDDGAGDSPELQFVGGSNDDTGHIYLEDNAQAGESDVVIKIPGGDYDTARLRVVNNDDLTDLWIVRADGHTYIPGGNVYFYGNKLVFEHTGGDTTIYSPADNQLTFEAGGAEICRIDGTGLILDDGAGDSPQLKFVGGSNDDEAIIYLQDSAGSRESDLIIKLPGDTSACKFELQDVNGDMIIRATGNGNVTLGNVAYFDSNGILMYAGRVIDVNGIADALVLDADGDTTISAPTDDEIDIEVGGSDVAEWKAGGLYGASGMDVYPEGDGGGLFQRAPNHWRSPDDHFNTFSGYTWAAYAPFDGAPSSISTAVFPSLLRLVNDNITEDHYAYESGHDTKIYARLTKGVDSYVGIRIQDSGDDNNDFVELRLIDGTTTGFFAIEIEYDVGGAGSTTTTLVDDIPPQFYLLQLAKSGNTVYAYYTVDTPIPLFIGSAAGMTWTMDRAGIVFGQRSVANSGSRAGLVDFVEVD